MTIPVLTPLSGRRTGDLLARNHTLRDLIWRKGAEVPALDPSDWRVDHRCRLMRYADFEHWGSEYGWTICDIDMSLLDIPGGSGATAAPIAFATLSWRFEG